MKKLLAIITVLTLLLVFSFVGCDGKTEQQEEVKQTKEAAETQKAEEQQEEPATEDMLPEGRLVSEPLTLSMWFPFTSDLIENANENVVFQELEKITGVTIDFVHPPAGQQEQEESFNLMLASNDLTRYAEKSTGLPRRQ